MVFFQGNQSKQLLEKVDLLERDLMNESSEAITNGLPFIQALRAFSKVVDVCFSQALDPTYKSSVQEFKCIWNLEFP